MPSEELFVNTDPLFDDVATLRGRFGGAGDVGATPVVTLSHAGATETLGILAGLADGVPSAMLTHLEIIARLTSIGALAAYVADSGD